jgi:hypothetical protein
MGITDQAVYTDAGTLSMAGTNWVHDIQAWSWDAGAIFKEGKGINTLYKKPVFVGRATNWDFDMQQSTGATEASDGSDPDDWQEYTGMDCGTIKLGLTPGSLVAYQTRTKTIGYTITNNPTKTDGKAIGDIDGYPVLGGRDVVFDIDLMCSAGDTDDPLIYDLSKEATRSNFQGAAAVCYGGYELVIGASTFLGTCAFMPKLKVVEGDLQILTLQIINRGLPTTLGTGNLISAAAFASPPTCAFDFRTGRNTMSGTAFIHSLRGTANDQEIITMSGKLQARGTVTYGS